ncbi:MAG: hypothetical protein LBD78_01585 [Spirochaetaceae bacterium]|jgi:hypothetical protein|nr:hypothetical protein [Spirochaetaceae bacterium]
MKVSRLTIALVILFTVIFPAAAQTISEEKKSEFYYVNIPIEKIYPYRKGYVISYRKGLYGMAQVYLPLEWFTHAAGKGDIVYIKAGRQWPSLTIYYKNKEFSHVRLNVRKEITHESWGNIDQGINIDDRFENVEDIKLEY